MQHVLSGADARAGAAAGVLHNTGALFLTIWEPLIHRFSSHGLCRMERTGLNILKSSLNIREKFQVSSTELPMRSLRPVRC